MDAPICIPGMQAEQEEEDVSDEEVMAERRERKKIKAAREEAEAAKAEEVRMAELKHQEECADKEQFIQALCDEHEAADVCEFLKSIEVSRPEEFDERIKVAGELKEKAKALFQEGNNEQAVKYWFAAVHICDFTPRQLMARSKDDRKTVLKEVVPVLSNLSLAVRKMGDPASACRAAYVGLEISRKLPYDESRLLRIKLRLRRAVAKGDQRKFSDAREDAQHVLQLDPDHEEAKTILRNSETALRREKGPEESRWKGVLTKPLPVKKVQKAATPYWKIAVVVVGPLLAFYALKVALF